MKKIFTLLFLAILSLSNGQEDSIKMILEGNAIFEASPDQIKLSANQNSQETLISEALGIGGIGLKGVARFSSFSNTNYGGWFSAAGTSGRGVYGLSTNSSGVNYGGYFQSNSSNGRGVYGVANGIGSVTNFGGFFESFGGIGYGIFARANAGSGIGIYAEGAAYAGQFKGNVEFKAKNNDAILSMRSITDSGANSSRVLIRQDATEDVYLGDIDPNNGSLFLRTNGLNAVSINTNQNVGIGTNNPVDQVEITSASNQGALRVRVGSTTRLRVHSNGGVSIGFNFTPPSEGLRIKNMEDGKNGIVKADGSGNLYKETEKISYYSIGPMEFRERDNGTFIMNESYLEVGGADRILFAPIHLPDNARITQMTMYYNDNFNANLKLKLIESSHINNTITDIVQLQSVGTGGDGQSQSTTVNFPVNNNIATYYLQLSVDGGLFTDILRLYSVHIKYAIQQ